MRASVLVHRHSLLRSSHTAVSIGLAMYVQKRDCCGPPDHLAHLAMRGSLARVAKWAKWSRGPLTFLSLWARAAKSAKWSGKWPAHPSRVARRYGAMVPISGPIDPSPERLHPQALAGGQATRPYNAVGLLADGSLRGDKMINLAPDFWPIFGPLRPTAGPGSPGKGPGSKHSAGFTKHQLRRPILSPIRAYFVFLYFVFLEPTAKI